MEKNIEYVCGSLNMYGIWVYVCIYRYIEIVELGLIVYVWNFNI